jgi:hypothetical protein
LVLRDGDPWLLIECKSGDIEPSPALLHFQRLLHLNRAFQLVARPGYDRQYVPSGVRVMDYERFFAGLVWRSILKRRFRTMPKMVPPQELPPVEA